MQTMIHNTTIVTADGACTVQHDATIVVEAERIAAIGPTAELLARYPAAERIDGRGKAVMPGFANTYRHLALTLARGVYEDLSPSHTPAFVGGLAPLPPLSAEERRLMCQHGVIEAIRSNTTPVLEDAVGIQLYADANAVFSMSSWVGQLLPSAAMPPCHRDGPARGEALACADGRGGENPTGHHTRVTNLMGTGGPSASEVWPQVDGTWATARPLPSLIASGM